MKRCVVNENALDSWLEPYIGYEFEIVKISKGEIFWKQDYGYDKPEIVSADKEYFDIIEENL